MNKIKNIKCYENTKNEIKIAYDRLKAISLYGEEKISLQQRINKLETYLESMEQSLKELSGLEYKIYYEIVVNNLNVTKAIDRVSMMEDKDPSTLWTKYYPKVKEEIKKIEII